MSTPFFSVIIPFYNRSSFLPDTLASVLSQDFMDFEVLCIDDGSTDASPEIAELFAKKDVRVKVIRHPRNLGRCAARNSGIANASAKWICFLDSDDLFLKNHLSVLFRLISAHPGKDAFATSFISSTDLTEKVNQNRKEKVFVVQLKDLIKVNSLSPPNVLCYNQEKIKLTFSEENIPVSEDWLFVRTLLTKTDVLKTTLKTTVLTEHPGRTMNAESIREIAYWNEYAGLLFADLPGLKKNISDEVKSHTFLLCANMLISNGHKDESVSSFKKALRLGRTFLNPLFYKYLTKYILK